MLINKEMFVNEKKAILSYDDAMFGKDANTLKNEGYTEAKLTFLDVEIKVELLINGEEYCSHSESKNISDFYFEVVDKDNSDNELSCSDPLYEVISNEKELVHVLAEESYFINNIDDFRRCPKGNILGYCSQKDAETCEFAASTFEGLCGAECQDCFSEMFASQEDGAYICGCSKILFEDRHREF